MAYPMYNQYYLNDLQTQRDRIENQIRQYQQQNQFQQQQVPQPITQNFQLAPNTVNNEIECKYANNIDEVRNTFVMKTGVFITKDYSNLWIKNINGEIRTFSLNEVIEMDEKDKQIYELKKEIEMMKGMIGNEHGNTNVDEPVTSQKSTRVSNGSKSNAK